MTRTALVVGAGIGGLSAAIALRKAGWHVRVFERASSVRELGFALLVAPNAEAVGEDTVTLGCEATGFAVAGDPCHAADHGRGPRRRRPAAKSPSGWRPANSL